MLTRNEQIMEDLKLSAGLRRILPLLMQGLSNAEIAQQLYVTEKNVKWHTGLLYKQTGLNSRARIMAGLAKIGWQMDAKVSEPKFVVVPQVGGLSVGAANGLFK